MSTTTELAQRMKAAAINAKDLGNIARYSKGYEAIKAFSALMTPDNVLALLGELETTKRRVTELEGMNAASVKYGVKVANSRDKLRNRVSELNSYHTAYIDWQEKTDWMQKNISRFKSIQPLGKHRADVLREYIEYLESRVVTVTLPEYRNSPDMHTKKYYETIGFNQGLDACIDALRAAGVAVEGE
ncbi:TPA: ead/Ea22-like family protein [Escherichia coli]